LPATACKPSLSMALIEATGSMALTSTVPSSCCRTITLQGSIAYTGLELERLIGHFRIAGAEDYVFANVGIQLGLHGFLDVDFCQNAETLCCERFPCSAHRFLEGGVLKDLVEGVVVHISSPLTVRRG
jgi:hypothetical protein